MNIDISEAGSLTELEGCLLAVDAENIESEATRLSADIRGVVYFYAYLEETPSELMVDELPPSVNWAVRIRVSLRYRAEVYFEAMSAIKHFTLKLLDFTQADYVLSFQREKVYAIRNKSVLRFTKSF